METIELISYKIKVPINSLYKSIFSSMIKILYILKEKKTIMKRSMRQSFNTNMIIANIIGRNRKQINKDGD
jgi:hypothetical protein